MDRIKELFNKKHIKNILKITALVILLCVTGFYLSIAVSSNTISFNNSHVKQHSTKQMKKSHEEIEENVSSPSEFEKQIKNLTNKVMIFATVTCVVAGVFYILTGNYGIGIFLFVAIMMFQFIFKLLL